MWCTYLFSALPQLHSPSFASTIFHSIMVKVLIKGLLVSRQRTETILETIKTSFTKGMFMCIFIHHMSRYIHPVCVCKMKTYMPYWEFLGRPETVANTWEDKIRDWNLDLGENNVESTCEIHGIFHLRYAKMYGPQLLWFKCVPKGSYGRSLVLSVEV